MSIISRLSAMWRNVIHRRRVDADLDEEVHAYLDLLADEHRSGGLTPEHARRTAMLELGGVEQVKERVRRVRAGVWIESLFRDFGYGLRVIRRSPGFSASAILTLALGIGATTAVFTIVDETLFRSVPYAHADRLVTIIGVDRPGGGGGSVLTPQAILRWQQAGLFDAFEGYGCLAMDAGADDDLERLTGCDVSTGLFSMLGVGPANGRSFLDTDGRPGDAPVVIVGAEFARRRFGSPDQAVGKTLLLNDAGYRIVGVMPRRFQLRDESLWLPINVQSPPADGAITNFVGVARLPPGVPLATVQERANVVGPPIQQAAGVRPPFAYIRLLTWHVAYVSDDARRAMLVLLGAVGCLLLIACANVANLLLARAVVREREAALRSALGASRARLIQQAIVENVPLSLLGGAIGILLAYWAIDFMVPMLPATTLSFVAGLIEIDRRVLIFAGAVTMATALLCSLLPAIRGSRADVDSTLRGASLSIMGAAGGALPGLLVVAQVALSLMLLIGGALMTRTFVKLHSIDPGFDPKNVAVFSVSVPLQGYATPDARAAFVSDLRRSLTANPHVTGVSFAGGIPGSSGFSFGIPEAEGSQSASVQSTVARTTVDSAYFGVMRIPLVTGRLFIDRDAPDAVIVNKALADYYWPDGSALGRRFRTSATDRWARIVGVVGNVYTRLDNRELNFQMYDYLAFQLPPAALRAPAATVPGAPRRYYNRSVIVRVDSPAAIADEISARVRAVDKMAVVSNVRWADDVYADFFAPQRFALSLMSLFSVIALVLASAGVFAVLAQTVARRTREIGLRVALGAEPLDVFRLIMMGGLALTATGVVIGLGGALALSRVLSSLLYEVSPSDWLSFVVVTIMVATVAFVACWFPTRRALSVDAAVALRAE